MGALSMLETDVKQGSEPWEPVLGWGVTKKPGTGCGISARGALGQGHVSVQGSHGAVRMRNW